VPADAGIHTFTNGVTLVTLGEQTVTATDNVTATITGSQTAITVQGGAVLLEVTGILDPLAPGQPTNVVVTAKDALGGVATTYTGTVHFTTTDPSLTVVLPPDYTFLPADAGVHTFTNGVTLRTIGEQTVTATDIVTATITGAQAAITVQPGPLHHVVLTPVLMTLTSLAQQQQYTAVGQDVFNNPVSPPAVFTWTATPGGVANVSGTGLATPVAAGTTTIRATSGGIFAEATLHVVVGLASITITPSNPTVTNLGTPTQFTAVARDAGNAPLSPQPPFVWTSSDTTVAIVDAGGQAGAGGNGVTTITASVVGIAAPVGNTNLTVNDGTAREVIVANYDDDDLSIVDGRTNTVTQTIGSGGGAPFGIALAPGGGTSYISNLASDNIGVLNNATKTLGTPITLAASSGPVGITTTPDGAYIATTTPGTNSLTLIRTSDNMITTVPIGAEPYEVVAISNNLIWVTNSTPQGYITQYNIATTDTIKKEAGFYTGGIAAHNGVLVVAAGGSNAVLFHDATTGVQLGVLNAGDGIGAQPDGVAITSGGIAYVANLGSNTVSVINVASRSLITNIPVGNRPRGVTVSPDGRLVYVVNEGGDPGVVDDAYVSVISTAMNEVVARVTVGLQAKRAVAR
jgi:YVTN family beta-propeller protein